MKIHMRDIRLRGNTGIDFPVCYASAKLLDTDKARLPTTGDRAAVTCKRCLPIFDRMYPWSASRSRAAR